MELTIGIATWNRHQLLEQTLESLAKQPIPNGVDFHVLVCDNRSTDSTEQVTKAFSDRLPLKYIYETTQGKTHALNRILAEATGEWIIFIDDDVCLYDGWLQAYVDGMRAYPEAFCLGGAIEPWLHYPDGQPIASKDIEKILSPHQRFVMKEYPPVVALLPLRKDIPMEYKYTVAYGPNMALRLDRIPKGGYSIRHGVSGGRRVAGGDVVMVNAMLSQEGGCGWLLANARVGHYITIDQLGLKRFATWQAGIGRHWQLSGMPEPMPWGLPWWLKRRWISALWLVCRTWRPWPTRRFYNALADLSREWGYLRDDRPSC